MADRTGDYYAIADDAIHGYGAELQMGDTAGAAASPGENYQSIAGLLTITPGEMTTADIDCTHLRSPDAHREHRAGIRDSGAITCTGVWLPTDESQSNAGGVGSGGGPFSSGGLIAIWRSRQNRNMKIVLAEGSPSNEFPFRAYCSQFQPGEIGIDDKINFTASFMPNQAYDASLP